MRSLRSVALIILITVNVIAYSNAHSLVKFLKSRGDGHVAMRLRSKLKECPQSDHIHLSIVGQNSTALAVSWSAPIAQTPRPDNAPVDYSPIPGYTPSVAYGPTPNHIEGIVSGESNCSQRRYFGDRIHFTCTLPDSVGVEKSFYYTAGDINCVNTLPLAAMGVAQPRQGKDVSVAIFGDMGTTQSDGTLITLKRELVTGNSTTLAIHVGDIAYGDDVNLIGPNPDYDPILDDFMSRIEPISARVPYMVSPGNHDVTCHIIGDDGCDTGLRNFSAFRHRWSMPSDASGAIGASNLWYAFEYGNIQFISISTETDYPMAPYNPDSGSARAGGFGDQLKWLEEQLQRATQPAAKRLRPWIVVYGHRPLYSTSNLDFPFDQRARIRNTFEPLFQKYGVDMYLAGHVHMYERTWPVFDEKIEQKHYNFPNSTVYINNGAAGNVEGHCNHYTQEIPEVIPLRDVKQFGIGIIRTNSTAAPRVLELCYDFLPASNTVRQNPMDTICITKRP